MLYMFLVMLIPVGWPIVAKVIWGSEFDWREFAISVAVAALISGGVYQLGQWAQTADTEILNGEVTSKASEHVSCEHSYTCNCRESCSGSGKDRSCSTTCDTCYEHSYDIDWLLKNSVDSPIKIDRVDRRGTVEPPRYRAAKVGDPVAVTHSHTNYIKAVPESLFNHAKAYAGTFEPLVPQYPLNIYDYHYINRVLAPSLQVADLDAWNMDVSKLLRKLGPAKQVNLVVVMAKTEDSNYQYALQHAWLGGKKNDVVVMLGVPEYPKLSWVRVMSWTDKELFKVELRDELAALEVVDRSVVLPIVAKHIEQSFVRKQMKDFEYLKSEISPSTWVILLAFFLGLGSSVALSIYFSRR
jgi:hypothetical protein